MANQSRYYPVNWIDGMKINKDHFLSQDNASQYALQQAAAVGLSPLRFGILPVHQTGDPNFDVKISLDNQKTLRVAVLHCQAMLLSGVVVSLPALGVAAGNQTDGVPATTFTFDPQGAEATWWVVLMVHPFEKQPVGKPDLDENPPRLPYLAPTYKIEVVSDSQYRQYATNPYSLTIGKVQVQGSDIRVDDYYIPPCYSVSAHPDLVALHSEFDQFMGSLEMKCSQIVQKIYSRNQQNELSELVLFVCDRIILYLGQSITYARWIMLHDSPAMLFAHIASLARIMKNSMDLRAGSGKEEMLNYLSEWSELKQGELESLLNSLATMRYNNNDVNANIQPIVVFVKVISKLFDTLSKLEFIGKKKESGIFVNEERNMSTSDNSQNKPKRRFFG